MEQQNQELIQNETNTPSDLQPKKSFVPNKSFYVAGGLGVAVLVILGIFVLIQSNGEERSEVGKGKDECRITGCSSQICSDQEVITTCEALPEHVCYKNAVCERQSNGSCGWTQTSELTQCLQAKSAKQTLIDTSTPSTSSGQAWQTYRNDEFGFEVEHPRSWSVRHDEARWPESDDASPRFTIGESDTCYTSLIFKSVTNPEKTTYSLSAEAGKKQECQKILDQILSTFRFVGDTGSSGVPPGYSSEIIQVKFVSGTDVDPPESTLPASLQSSVATIRRLFTLSDEELDRIGGAQLKLWFEIKLKAGVNPIQFIEELRSLNNVESAQFAPLFAPLP